MSLRLRNIVVVLFLYCLFGCKEQVVVDKSINGISESQLISKFGIPKSQGFIHLTNRTELSEMQSNLSSIYKNLKEDDTVLIKQLYWEYPNGDKMAIWLEKKERDWKVIDNLKWSKDIKF